MLLLRRPPPGPFLPLPPLDQCFNLADRQGLFQNEIPHRFLLFLRFESCQDACMTHAQTPVNEVFLRKER